MSENNLTEHQAELQQVQSFYISIIDNLKGQIADIADQKATQFAHNQQTIQSLSNQIKELEKTISELSKK